MDIKDWIWEQVAADQELSEKAQWLIVAAVEGDAEFAAVVGGETPQKPVSTQVVADPKRAFLKTIVVEGFRGIGPKSKLELTPAPGLTVVAGRNGSGKSSFAEAVDIALRGRSERGKKRPTLGDDQWRNLHHAKPSIEVQTVLEGAGLTTLGVQWSENAGLDECQRWTQELSQKRVAGAETLGWNQALELYTPTLSYDELGGVFDRNPSQFHDALEAFLGLAQVTEATKRLNNYVKAVSEPSTRLRAATSRVKAALSGVDDERASTTLTVISSRAPDIEVVRTLLAGGSGSADPRVSALERLATYVLPDWSLVVSALAEVQSAENNLKEALVKTGDIGMDAHDLLIGALAYHQDHGDGLCPVCGQGQLGQEWAQKAQETVEASKAVRQSVSEARQRRTQADRGWVNCQPMTPRLEGVQDVLNVESLASAVQAWQEVAKHPCEVTVEDAGRVYEIFRVEAVAVVGRAQEEARSRQNKWAEVVQHVAEWLSAYEAAENGRDTLARAKEAHEWLKTNGEKLRNSRLEPLTEESRRIWSKLKQQSNVDLGAITLEGSANRRRVDLRARVDDSDETGVAVMSQGELHALALSLFIPRANSDASPFGFIIFDDPIQAMDPSKIDGLIDVLSDLARTRQVVVFSHDDRLPDALRRSSVEARLVEIVRGKNSVVSVSDLSNPSQRYIDEARAVLLESHLTTQDMMRVIPGLCRHALESQCKDMFYVRLLGSGSSRDEVEKMWNDAHKTSTRLMLAVDKDQDGLNRWRSTNTLVNRALGICTSGFHKGLEKTTPEDAIRTVDRLIDHLKAMRL
ncbi:MAG: AAA family ATPase [Propionibacteriaceae bacterium]|jgi:recombinational DNA repair ATPase RecF|nr:AAA family ATPase [Propionibacteriaceae bacterium]